MFGWRRVGMIQLSACSYSQCCCTMHIHNVSAFLSANICVIPLLGQIFPFPFYHILLPLQPFSVNFLPSYQYLLLLHFHYRWLCVLLLQIYGASEESFILKWVLSAGDNFVVFKVHTWLILLLLFIYILFLLTEAFCPSVRLFANLRVAPFNPQNYNLLNLSEWTLWVSFFFFFFFFGPTAPPPSVPESPYSRGF